MVAREPAQGKPARVKDVELAYCWWCGDYHRYVRQHFTHWAADTTDCIGPLCERCWKVLTIEKKLYIYRACYDIIVEEIDPPEGFTWPRLRTAVLAGR